MDGRPSIYLMNEVATKRERNFQLGALLFHASQPTSCADG